MGLSTVPDLLLPLEPTCTMTVQARGRIRTAGSVRAAPSPLQRTTSDTASAAPNAERKWARWRSLLAQWTGTPCVAAGRTSTGIIGVKTFSSASIAASASMGLCTSPARRNRTPCAPAMQGSF
ncbi:TNFRSF1A isoform 1 [Pongo abelii]|uniref:TNFRSF1A isoform 1 n=1 Tax=Pongo abelii TaxID=9601 RepID=A0A2J8TAY5_PONAB|nr:TNFRSF1A isoform 1 [Pongo abelii]